MLNDRQLPRHAANRLRLVVFCLLSIAVGCGSSKAPTPIEPDQAVGDFLLMSKRAIAEKNWDAAETQLLKQLTKAPKDSEAIALLAEVKSAKREFADAADLYQSLIDSQESPNRTVLDNLATVAMQAGRPYQTLSAVQAKLLKFPGDIEAKYDICGLAIMLGQTELAIEPLRWLVQHQRGDADSLLALADPQQVEPDVVVCQRALKSYPADQRAKYGIAKHAAMKSDWQRAEALLRQVTEAHKDFLPAFALLGRCLAEQEKYSEIPAWYSSLPPGIDNSPEFFIAAGLWSLHQKQPKQAAKAFWEALRVGDPFHPRALSGLEQSLRVGGDDANAKLVAGLILKVTKLRDAIKTHLERKDQSQAAALAVANQMLAVGRFWEAEGWARIAMTLPRDHVADARQQYIAIRSSLNVNTPWLDRSQLITSQIDATGYPEVDWKSSLVGRRRIVTYGADGKLRFSDQATSRKLVHNCDIAVGNKEPGHWIYQSAGGGIAVIDYDLDGWPDITGAKLDGQPLDSDSAANQIFRNLNGSFEQVEQTGYIDTGFTHGITVGDFNGDGFPDVLDANYGRNSLFRNNGDGTFSEVANFGFEAAEWTTSAVVADINGDGYADIYEAAYCEPNKPLTHRCRTKKHRLATCSPLQFESNPDRVYRGNGDGTFTDVTKKWMKQTTPGRGLGVLVGEFDELPGLDLYIANDMTANHLWSSTSKGQQYGLSELGVIRGLGVNLHSLSQASMGMAVGDPDADGDLDFFLTHFANDHNTFYEQSAPGVWTDRSFQVGLANPSMNLLGFGTEWVDFDNNGSLELFITNGHVDDLASDSIAYKMPAQVFIQSSSGGWVESDVTKMGDYFRKDHLGRALVCMDANRDGLQDIAITHVDEPTCLLMNQSKQTGNWIRLELKATNSQRDAIGAKVTFGLDGHTFVKQLTAGDGYMCTNERCIHIGTAAHDAITNVQIQWPSGAIDRHGDIEAGSGYIVVEGETDAFRVNQSKRHQ